MGAGIRRWVAFCLVFTAFGIATGTEAQRPRSSRRTASRLAGGASPLGRGPIEAQPRRTQTSEGGEARSREVAAAVSEVGRIRVSPETRGHFRDQPQNVRLHGVFDAPSQVRSIVRDAVNRAGQGEGQVVSRQGNRVEVDVPVGRRVGHLGGQAGATAGDVPLTSVRLTLERGRLISAQPVPEGVAANPRRGVVVLHQRSGPNGPRWSVETRIPRRGSLETETQRGPDGQDRVVALRGAQAPEVSIALPLANPAAARAIQNRQVAEGAPQRSPGDGCASSICRVVAAGQSAPAGFRAPLRHQVQALRALGVSAADRRAFFSGEPIMTQLSRANGDPTIVALTLGPNRLTAAIFSVNDTSGSGFTAFTEFRRSARDLARRLGVGELELQGQAIVNPRIEALLRRQGFEPGQARVPAPLGGGTIDVMSRVYAVD